MNWDIEKNKAVKRDILHSHVGDFNIWSNLNILVLLWSKPCKRFLLTYLRYLCIAAFCLCHIDVWFLEEDKSFYDPKSMSTSQIVKYADNTV